LLPDKAVTLTAFPDPRKDGDGETMKQSSHSRLTRRARRLTPTETDELSQAVKEVLGRDLSKEQVTELVTIHEGYLAYRDSSEPFVSDVRFLSESEYFDYYTKLRSRARKLLDTLQDKARDLRKAPEYRKFLSELMFSNVIKEVEFVLSVSDQKIREREFKRDPEKLIAFLESGEVRFVPPVDRLPPEILQRIRKQKRRKGGPTPDYLLHGYVRSMATWCERVTGSWPNPRSKSFNNLVQQCLWVIDEKKTIGEKAVRNVLKERP
jgi:hypothetical protein